MGTRSASCTARASVLLAHWWPSPKRIPRLCKIRRQWPNVAFWHSLAPRVVMAVTGEAITLPFRASWCARVPQSGDLTARPHTATLSTTRAFPKTFCAMLLTRRCRPFRPLRRSRRTRSTGRQCGSSCALRYPVAARRRRFPPPRRRCVASRHSSGRWRC